MTPPLRHWYSCLPQTSALPPTLPMSCVCYSAHAHTRTYLHGLFLCGASQQLRIAEVSITFLSFHHLRSDLLQETEWDQTNPSPELNGGRRGTHYSFTNKEEALLASVTTPAHGPWALTQQLSSQNCQLSVHGNMQQPGPPYQPAHTTHTHNT